jgi:hypothetical protein
MSFQNIQAMRAAIDMVMRVTNEAKPRAEVSGLVSHLAIENDISAAALADFASLVLITKGACRHLQLADPSSQR